MKKLDELDPVSLNTIHDRLKWARQKAGYRTVKEFADKNDVPYTTYASYERGVRNAKQDEYARYADILGVSLSWLLVGDKAPFPTEEMDRPSEVVPAGKKKDFSDRLPLLEETMVPAIMAALLNFENNRADFTLKMLAMEALKIYKEELPSYLSGERPLPREYEAEAFEVLRLNKYVPPTKSS